MAGASACGGSSSNPRDAGSDRGPDGSAGDSRGTGGAAVDGGSHDVGGLGGMGGAADAGATDAGDDVVSGEDAGGVDAAPETCGPDGHGCARLSVPLTDPQTGTFFPISTAPTHLPS